MPIPPTKNRAKFPTKCFPLFYEGIIIGESILNAIQFFCHGRQIFDSIHTQLCSLMQPVSSLGRFIKFSLIAGIGGFSILRRSSKSTRRPNLKSSRSQSGKLFGSNTLGPTDELHPFTKSSEIYLCLTTDSTAYAETDSGLHHG